MNVADLRFRYDERSLLSFLRRRKTPVPYVVDGVSFALPAGETLGIVGESGSGKTTIGRLILGMMRPDGGSIGFRGQDVSRGRRDGDLIRAVQIVFQNPLDSLDPRMRIGEQVEEPLRIQGLGSSAERRQAADAALEQVGLPMQIAGRFPHEISGGQAQRAVIARAMVLDPQLIVLDEPLSALDLSVQAQIINLLLDLQRDLGLAYLFISHDLRMVSYLCHQVLVLYRGRIVESGATKAVFASPTHPYTRILLSSVPRANADARPDLLRPVGESMSNEASETGCSFHVRCPFAEARCWTSQPALQEISTGHRVACHLAPTGDVAGLPKA
ncbi:MAG: ATP-binding cassette domain-containing protein [Alphaproteobacteria bacterium]|nr:ATP-binding cassette domain-containing protein [Alphaproteobacteria bacterium]